MVDLVDFDVTDLSCDDGLDVWVLARQVAGEHLVERPVAHPKH